ncbi:lebercilin-like protein [Engraulis encrasicolus]|uniref:lebercilin-like protein n=1 Tax=Engraulis encrasicolus TaxID=184585 RepID=UPI002FD1FD08
MSSEKSDDSQDEGGQGDGRSFSGSDRSFDGSTASNKSRDCSPARSEDYYSYSYHSNDEKETPYMLCKSHFSTAKKPLKKTTSFYKGQRRPTGQHPHLKKCLKAGRKAPLFPPIKPLNGVGQRIASAREHRIKELSNQVWELQQQLNGAWQENRLLRRVQSRHTVALQQFQDSQSGLPQILAKHGNEVQSLQGQLRKTREQRNALSRRLTRMETLLQQASEELQRLQTLCSRRHLGEREELTLQLRKLQLELEIKNKRILDLERNRELSNASFSRHLTTEMRKTVEARDLSSLLQEQIDHLSLKIKERERELENQNIYAHRFPKSKKGSKETKCIQTDGLSPLPLEGPALKLELEYASQEHLDQELDRQRSTRNKELCATDGSEAEREPASAAEQLDEDRQQQDWPAGAGATVNTAESVEELPQQQQAADEYDNADEDVAEDDEDGAEEDEECSTSGSEPVSLSQAEPSRLHRHHDLDLDRHRDQHSLLEDPSRYDPSNRFSSTMARPRRHYTFKETIQNLHRGQPAYGIQQNLHRGQPSYGPQKGSRAPNGNGNGNGQCILLNHFMPVV